VPKSKKQLTSAYKQEGWFSKCAFSYSTVAVMYGWIANFKRTEDY